MALTQFGRSMAFARLLDFVQAQCCLHVHVIVLLCSTSAMLSSVYFYGQQRCAYSTTDINRINFKKSENVSMYATRILEYILHGNCNNNFQESLILFILTSPFYQYILFSVQVFNDTQFSTHCFVFFVFFLAYFLFWFYILFYFVFLSSFLSPPSASAEHLGIEFMGMDRFFLLQCSELSLSQKTLDA